MTSFPAPPFTASMLRALTTSFPAPSTRASLPPPKSKVPFTAAVMVMRSFAAPAVTFSMPISVTTLVVPAAPPRMTVSFVPAVPSTVSTPGVMVMELVPVPSTTLSRPRPSEAVAPVVLAPKVTTSAEEDPTTFSTPESVITEAAPSVTVSLRPPPLTTSTPVTITELAKLPRFNVSIATPAPRSKRAPVAAVVTVTVSA